MKCKRKFNYLVITLIIILLLTSGCSSSFITDNTPSLSDGIDGEPVPSVTAGSIIIAGGAETIKDCTPSLAIFSEEATQMSFSGDGENWTGWIDYDTSYNDFNIANGLYGTLFGSGTKNIYVRFKDKDDSLSPSDELAFDTIEYEMQELFSIKIYPQKVTIPIGGSYLFTLKGYDLKSNEVPLDNLKVTWTKCCSGVGALSPTIGLSTTYIAPSTAGERNITGHYNNLQTGAVITVTRSD